MCGFAVCLEKGVFSVWHDFKDQDAGLNDFETTLYTGSVLYVYECGKWFENSLRLGFLSCEEILVVLSSVY